MNKYELKLNMIDGSTKYDFSEMTSKTVEQMIEQYKNIIEKAKQGNRVFESFKEVLSVEVN
jgi:hypothetical protein